MAQREKHGSGPAKPAGNSPVGGDRRSWRRAAKWTSVSVAVPVLAGTLTWMVQKALEPAVGEDKPGASAAGSATGRVSPSPSAPAGPAVKVDLVRLERMDDQAGTWVFPEPIDFTKRDLAEQAKSDEEEYASGGSSGRWARARGGVDPWVSHIKVVLRGNRSDQVRLVGMRAITKCGPPLTGTILYSPPAGEAANIGIGFKLDDPHPYARTVSPEGELGGDYFANKTITLARGESAAMQIKVLPGRQYCEYRLQLDLLVNETRVTQTIDDDGRPFRVSAVLTSETGPTLSAYQAAYIGGVAYMQPHPPGAWKRVDPRVFDETPDS